MEPQARGLVSVPPGSHSRMKRPNDASGAPVYGAGTDWGPWRYGLASYGRVAPRLGQDMPERRTVRPPQGGDLVLAGLRERSRVAAPIGPEQPRMPDDPIPFMNTGWAQPVGKQRLNWGDLVLH